MREVEIKVNKSKINWSTKCFFFRWNIHQRVKLRIDVASFPLYFSYSQEWNMNKDNWVE